jgi:hypothetical protein
MQAHGTGHALELDRPSSRKATTALPEASTTSWPTSTSGQVRSSAANAAETKSSVHLRVTVIVPRIPRSPSVPQQLEVMRKHLPPR